MVWFGVHHATDEYAPSWELQVDLRSALTVGLVGKRLDCWNCGGRVKRLGRRRLWFRELWEDGNRVFVSFREFGRRRYWL